MRNHKWSDQDYALLEKNVKKHGVAIGCKRTAEQLYVTDKAARAMYQYKLKKFKESGIKVDHPEVVKQAKVVEEKKQPKWSRWTEVEIEVLKNNLVKYGFKKGCEKTSISTGRDYISCKNKSEKLIKNGLDGYRKRVNFNEKEDELVTFFENRISENPNNLQAIFREGAELFGVSKDTLQKRWYGTNGLSERPTCRKNMKTVYTVLGKSATINGKNQNHHDIEETKNIFDKVVDWFKNKLKK